MGLFDTLRYWDQVMEFHCLVWVTDFTNLQSDTAWVALGLVPVALFMTLFRLAIVAPRERNLVLWALRKLALLGVLITGLFPVAAYFMWSRGLDYIQTYYYPQAQQQAIDLWKKLVPYVHDSIYLSGYGAIAGLVLGAFGWFAVAYWGEPWFVKKLRWFTKKVGSDTLTDVRSIEDHVPESREFEPRKYMEKAQAQDCVFLGLDQERKPVYVSRRDWKQSNVQIMGLPGAGKGVQAAVALAQGLAYGDAVYIFDPKFGGDEWAPSVYAHVCAALKLPMVKVDLAAELGGINPLEGISRTNLETTLINALGLAHTHGIDDVYRGEDRKAVAKLATLADQGPVCLASLADGARGTLDESEVKAARKFLNGLEEVAQLKAAQVLKGMDLTRPLRQGGVLYFTGSTTNARVILLQRILMLRVLQLVEQRPAGGRHVSILADEFKHHLTPYALTALGTMRDRGCNLILTHQSMGDFGELPQLDSDQVKTTIADTTAIKWFYRAMDEANAKWVAGHTGTILVNRDRVTAESNEVGAELTHGRRTVEQVPRYLIDVNMVQHLPKGCAVCVGVGKAKLAFASPLKGPKYKFKDPSFPLYERRASAGDWLKMPPLVTAKDDEDQGGNGGGDAGGALL